MSADVVRKRMDGRLHPDGAPGWEWVQVSVCLEWSPDDPLAVEVGFAGCGWAADWSVSRDVLADGLERSAGAADFVVAPEAPATTSRRSTRTRMILRAPRRGADGEPDHTRPEHVAVVTVVTRSLRAVLEATFEQVAAGGEYAPGSPCDLALEDELLDLFGVTGS